MTTGRTPVLWWPLTSPSLTAPSDSPMLPAHPALPALVAAQERGVEAVLAACGVPADVRSVRVLRHHSGPAASRRPDRKFALRGQGLPAQPGGPSDHPHPLGRRRPRPAARAERHRAGRLRRRAGVPGAGVAGRRAHRRTPRRRPRRAGGQDGSRRPRTSGANGLEPYGAVPLLGDLARWCEAMTNADAVLGERAAVLRDRLHDNPPPRGRHGLLHDSFSVNHLLDLGNGPGVLDWDEPRHGPVELDAGAFLASLRRHAGQQPEHSAAAAAAAAGLLTTAGARLDRTALAWYRRAALVKHAKHAGKLQAPGWRRVAEDLLAAAGRDLVIVLAAQAVRGDARPRPVPGSRRWVGGPALPSPGGSSRRRRGPPAAARERAGGPGSG